MVLLVQAQVLVRQNFTEVHRLLNDLVLLPLYHMVLIVYEYSNNLLNKLMSN